MTATAAFFTGLAGQSHHVLLEKVNGVIHLVLTDGPQSDTWSVIVSRGDLSVVHGPPDGPATCEAHVPQALFEEIVDGRTHAMCAALRGELVVEGDLQLMLMFSRVFRGPPPRPT